MYISYDFQFTTPLPCCAAIYKPLLICCHSWSVGNLLTSHLTSIMHVYRMCASVLINTNTPIHSNNRWPASSLWISQKFVSQNCFPNFAMAIIIIDTIFWWHFVCGDVWDILGYLPIVSGPLLIEGEMKMKQIQPTSFSWMWMIVADVWSRSGIIGFLSYSYRVL